MDGREKAVSLIIERLIRGETGLERLKKDAAERYCLESMVKNSEILQGLEERDRELGTADRDRFLPLLRKRPMRTLSGVSPIAVMVRPEGSCPYSCIYCPGGLGAKSYTGFEPAALRARQEGFDAYGQVRNRIEHYSQCGHVTDKCEIIVMGGTFLRMPSRYRRSFIKGIYDGLNGKRSRTLEAAKKSNEKAMHRAIGLTMETRPDVCGEEEISEMLSFGATRVELGVQHPDDGIYGTICRGHTVEDVIQATRLLKDSAFKVCYHIMPGLPGSDPKKDIAMARRLFDDERLRPDMLKIYPTLVMPGTGLERLMDGGKYEPYDSEQAADVISEFYRHIPGYVRIMRVMRDIPAKLIGRGATKSNLRELVERRLEEKGIISREIRSRELGLKKRAFDQTEFRLERMDYDASGGRESFLSFEDGDGVLAGFLRLRLPGSTFRDELEGETALVRELHVYGPEAQVGKQGRVQHKGIGSKLLEEAERISLEAGVSKVAVISGVGAREYYRKRGYALEGAYMVKRL